MRSSPSCVSFVCAIIALLSLPGAAYARTAYCFAGPPATRPASSPATPRPAGEMAMPSTTRSRTAYRGHISVGSSRCQGR